MTHDLLERSFQWRRHNAQVIGLRTERRSARGRAGPSLRLPAGNAIRRMWEVKAGMCLGTGAVKTGTECQRRHRGFAHRRAHDVM